MDCNFCGIKIPKGTDYIFVTAKGKALYFCTSKCYKNLVKLDRKIRHTKWTQAYMLEKQSRLKFQDKPSEQKTKAVNEEAKATPAKAADAPKPVPLKKAPAKENTTQKKAVTKAKPKK
jgi:large subunit ribosomal protein L24e